MRAAAAILRMCSGVVPQQPPTALHAGLEQPARVELEVLGRRHVREAALDALRQARRSGCATTGSAGPSMRVDHLVHAGRAVAQFTPIASAPHAASSSAICSGPRAVGHRAERVERHRRDRPGTLPRRALARAPRARAGAPRAGGRSRAGARRRRPRAAPAPARGTRRARRSMSSRAQASSSISPVGPIDAADERALARRLARERDRRAVDRARPRPRARAPRAGSGSRRTCWSRAASAPARRYDSCTCAHELGARRGSACRSSACRARRARRAPCPSRRRTPGRRARAPSRNGCARRLLWAVCAMDAANMRPPRRGGQAWGRVDCARAPAVCSARDASMNASRLPTAAADSPSPFGHDGDRARGAVRRLRERLRAARSRRRRARGEERAAACRPTCCRPPRRRLRRRPSPPPEAEAALAPPEPRASAVERAAAPAAAEPALPARASAARARTTAAARAAAAGTSRCRGRRATRRAAATSPSRAPPLRLDPFADQRIEAGHRGLSALRRPAAAQRSFPLPARSRSRTARVAHVAIARTLRAARRCARRERGSPRAHAEPHRGPRRERRARSQRCAPMCGRASRTPAPHCDPSA